VAHVPWRAVAQDGKIRDSLVQRRRDKKAVQKFFRKLRTGLRDVPRVLVTAMLPRSGVAKRAMLPGVEHRQHCHLNTRAETSHQWLAVTVVG
jgi:putative transposase